MQEHMDIHCLGNTRLTVSTLGLGTVELGMPYGIGLPEPPPADQCIALLHEAHRSGIAFIDTAAAYGRSEELVGRAFSSMSERPTIATKVSTQPPGAEAPLRGRDLHEHIEAQVSRSRTRLQLEQLDLLQFHNLEPRQLDDDLFETMERLCSRGWVRYWGASTYGVESPRAVMGHTERFASLQIAYNLLDRTLEDTVLPDCRRLGVGVIVRSVFLKGVLSDRCRDLPDHLEPLRRAAMSLADLARQAGMSLAEMALRFVAFSPHADVVLFGTADAAEMRANLKAAAAGPLPDDLLAAARAVQVPDPALLNPGTWGF